MPRSSLADRFDRASLGRASGGNGSLGRYSVGTDISGGSAATRHWVNSVSDIYGPDEIEELLEDLNRLELAAFETEDIQDFDIDGSQVGSVTVNNRRGKRKGGGPRGARPPRDEGRGESPTFSVSSWDSHAVYQHYHDTDEGDEGCEGRAAADLEPGIRNGQGLYFVRRMHSILCFCDISTFKSPRTLLRVLFVLTCTACLLCLFTAPTAPGSWDNVEYYVPDLSHLPKLRFLMFICIFSLMFTLFVLFLNISHLNALFPMDLGLLQSVVYATLTIAFIVSSAFILHIHIDRQSSLWSLEPFWIKNHLLVAALLGFTCSLETFLCMFNCGQQRKAYEKMLLQESSTHFTLQETATHRGPLGGPSAPPTTTNEMVQPILTATAPALGGQGRSIPTHPNHNHTHYPSQTVNNAMRQSKSATLPYPAQKQYLVNENYSCQDPPTQSAPLASQQPRQPYKGGHTEAERPDSDNRHHRSKASTDTCSSQRSSRHPSKTEGTSSQPPKLPPPLNGTANSGASSSGKGGFTAASGKSKPNSVIQQSTTSFTIKKAPASSAQARSPSPGSVDLLTHRTTTKALVQPEPSPATNNRTEVNLGCSGAPTKGSVGTKANGGPSRDTGAIPKKKKTTPSGGPPDGKPRPTASLPPPHQPSTSSAKKASTNHLDEIISIPLDDDLHPKSTSTKLPFTSKVPSSIAPSSSQHKGLKNGDSGGVEPMGQHHNEGTGRNNAKKLK